MGFVNDTTVRPRRTVDHQRNIALYYVGMSGGSASDIEMLELRWGNDIISFSTRRTVTDNGKKGDIKREILGIRCPSSLHVEFNDLVEVIKEALEAYGEMHHREFVDNIHVTISPNIQINGMKI